MAEQTPNTHPSHTSVQPGVRHIASPANAAVKAVRALHQKKHRESSGRFLAEGLRVLSEAVERGHAIETLVLLEPMRSHRVGRRLEAACLEGGGEVLVVSEAVLAKVARKDNPQGAVGVLRQRWETLESIDARRDFCWVALESIRDPGNLGTILRTCDAVGAEGAILIDHCCDPYSIEGVRASMGSVFAQRLVRAEFDEFRHWRHKQGGILVGASLKGTMDYQEISYPRPVFLFMGNEQSGLPESYEDACDSLVRIPMRGGADSLNVSIAASLMLYEIYNQDRKQ